MLDNRSLYLRGLILNSIVHSERGHVGSSLSMVEILRVLYDDFLYFNPQKPLLETRDRFILSKGHGCLALYAILADKGFFPLEELNSVASPNSFLGGHPERGHVPGIEASTGSLGHGLSIAIGMALASRVKKISYRVVALLGDGELGEGSIWEGVLAAAQHKLDNLTIFIDKNDLQIYGKTSDVLNIDPLKAKFEAFGWSAVEVSGHSISCLREVCKSLALRTCQPTAVICKTIKGKGLPVAENNIDWHYKHFLLSDEKISLKKYAEELCVKKQ